MSNVRRHLHAVIALSRSSFDATVRIIRRGPDTYAGLSLHVPAFDREFPVEIHLASGSSVVADDTFQTIRELTSMPPDVRSHVRELLYEHAMRAKAEVAFGDPNPPPEVPPSNLFRQLFWRPNKYRFVPLSHEDPRHPCYFVNGLESVDAKIEWLRFRIDENETTAHRFALLECRPAWEDEHGVSVVFRDGAPVGVTDPGASLSKYDGV